MSTKPIGPPVVEDMEGFEEPQFDEATTRAILNVKDGEFGPAMSADETIKALFGNKTPPTGEGPRS